MAEGMAFGQQQYQEIQNQEDADHNGYIVVGQDAQP